MSEIHTRVKSVSPDYVFSKEFSNLSDSFLNKTSHVLAPTLDALSKQTFKDFEALLCHKFPEDAEELVNNYSNLMNIRLIKEKPSIWHDLGNYPTVNSIRNTGILHSKGELLVFLDDCTIFNQNLLQDIWNEYQNGFYTTAKAIRRIRYEPKAVQQQINAREIIVDKDIRGSNNFFKSGIGDEIPISASWTYCTSVSLKETLKLGGFEEIWDGSFGGTDADFGRRLGMISRFRRKLIGNIYEFSLSKGNPKRKIRDDETLRFICGQIPVPQYIRANTWKPTKEQLDKYSEWHKKNLGDLDENWDKLVDVKMFDMKEEWKKINE